VIDLSDMKGVFYCKVSIDACTGKIVLLTAYAESYFIRRHLFQKLSH